MKKKASVPEQLDIPRQIDAKTFSTSMRRLRSNPDFELLREFWRGMRRRIIDQGKSKPTEAQWSKLDGFDEAVFVSEIYAAKQYESYQNERAADLAQHLA